MTTRPELYHFPEGLFPKDFKVGDRVRSYIGTERGGTEGWTTVVAIHDEEHFVVKADEFRWAKPNQGTFGTAFVELTEAGRLFLVDGEYHLIQHVDNLKSEAQGNEERYLYLLEEQMAGLG